MAGTKNRVSRQTDEVLQAVCSSLRLGVPLARSFRIAGIGERTGFLWRSQGWEAIESHESGSGDELSFPAKFAVAVEAALSEFMAPLIRQINETAQGKGDKGRDAWRAAKELLAARFPDEWSERTHVAKSQRVEISGGIGLKYRRREYDRMSNEELQSEIDRLWIQEHVGLSGGALDKKIARHEIVLADLCKQRDQQRGNGALIPGNLTRRPPVELVASDGSPVIEHERVEVQVAAPADPFEVPEKPRRRGIGYDQHGLAFNLSDEDLSL